MIDESLEVVIFPYSNPGGWDSKVWIVVRIFTDRVTGARWAFQDLRPFYTDGA